jgi:MoaA/NifB/PqqE/SkfB family radical SAM enzyme
MEKIQHLDPSDIIASDQNEIDVEGFKIRISDLIQNKLLPKYFKAPLIGLWEITRACNLDCIHCYNNSGKKLVTELSHAQRLDIAQQIVDAKIMRICLSGGEPILCKSFWDVAKKLKQGKVMCNTITNGWYVDEETAKKFSKYFGYIQVSIDGAKAKTHDTIRGKKGSFDRAVNACKYLVENGVKLSICFTINSINANEIEKAIELANSLGAFSFRTDRVRFLGRAAINQNKYNINPSDEQISIMDRIIHENKKKYENEMIIEYFTDSVRAYTDLITQIPNYILYISPSGRCAPDSMIPFSGGSLKENSLLKIWDELKNCNSNPKYVELVKQIKTNKDFLNLPVVPYVGGELHDK